MAETLPLIDLAAGDDEIAARIGAACRAHGFFYVANHGVEAALCERLERVSRAFFALPEPEKMRSRMALGGRAWRGYFPTGGELTSGRPDWKEGLYLGTELPPEHPQVRAGTPLHGPNLWPDVPGLRETVLAYIDAVAALGHRLMGHIAASLGLERDYFAARYTADPLILFRIFNYPDASASPTDAPWGVGEHTDYGLLTILLQDDVGGLEVRTPQGWITAPPLPGTFVCNLGDMLDRMSGGLYKSTPHRVVVNRSGRDRLSFPLFFDPNFHVRVQPLPGVDAHDDSAARWDGANVHAFEGSYGDYLLAKVSKVFPQLKRAVL